MAGARVPLFDSKSAYPVRVLTPVRAGAICVGIVAMLMTASCSSMEPKVDPTATSSESQASVVPALPSPSGDSTSAEPSPSPSLTAPNEPGDDPTTTSPPPPEREVASIPGASAQVSLVARDPATNGLLVGGYVEGLVEDDGSCTYVISRQGANDITASTTGVANHGTTSCGSTVVPAAQAPAGTYTVTLVYVNSKGSVSSSPMTVEIP